MKDFFEDQSFIAELEFEVPDNPVMFAGWRGCMEWASRKTELVESYKTERGLDSFDPTNRSDMLLFVDWANEMIWGEVDGPDEET